MTILGPLCVLIVFVGLASYYWKQLADENPAYDLRWYLTWLVKGLVFPSVLWLLLNVGHTPVMPPIVKVMLRHDIGQPPTIIYPPSAAPNAAPVIIPGKPKIVGVGPIAYVVIQTGPAVAVIGSFWGALTFAWLMKLLARRAPDRRGFIVASVVWGMVTLPFMVWIVWASGPGASGFALSLLFAPIVHCLTIMETYEDPVPRYTGAIVKMKFGKYAEAEQAILKELEKCENDFDGWLMLAELYARQFDDLEEAERTVMDLCDEPGTTVSQVSVALQKLADWQLQFRGDPVAAKRSLDEIIKRMPGTLLATMAGHRIRQLPASKQELAEQHNRKLKMPALNDELDFAVEQVAEANPAEAEAAANRCVEKLKNDPNDTEAREKLARIFAERMGQVSLGLSQLELLMEMPEQPSNKLAEWISLMAAWQMKYLGDTEAARKLLQRLIKEFPQSAQAFAAQRRLMLMEMETRGLGS